MYENKYIPGNKMTSFKYKLSTVVCPLPNLHEMVIKQTWCGLSVDLENTEQESAENGE